jgi:ribosomal protein S27AE
MTRATTFAIKEGRTMSDKSCSACGAEVASYDGVFLSEGENTRFLCSRCYNETVAEYLGLDYEHVAFEPVTLEDRDGMPHIFHFRTHVFSDQLSLEALETGPRDGYEFSVIADAEQDLFVTFRELFERIRRELGRKHIEPERDGHQITDAGVVRGQITSDLDGFDSMPLLIVDGKPVTWEELGRMVSPYMGFRFKLEIFDRSEER